MIASFFTPNLTLESWCFKYIYFALRWLIKLYQLIKNNIPRAYPSPGEFKKVFAILEILILNDDAVNN